MSFGVSSGMFSNVLGATSATASSGSATSAGDASFANLFQEAQQHLSNPTGMGAVDTELTAADDSLSRLSNDAFNAVKMQIQMKLQSLMEQQKAETQTVPKEALSKTEELLQFANYLGALLNDQTRSSDHEKAEDLLGKVLVKLQERAADGDLDAQAFLIDLV